MGYYYGVDTNTSDRRTTRFARVCVAAWASPDTFLIVLASRISHEKDPETVLNAVALARARGLDAVLLNLGGGYEDSSPSRDRSGYREGGVGPGSRGRASHAELADYFRCADLLVQGSLAEGLGLSPLEALACGTPVVATAVGGMAELLRDYARLTPRWDAAAMAHAILDWRRARCCPSPSPARASVCPREVESRARVSGVASSLAFAAGSQLALSVEEAA